METARTDFRVKEYARLKLANELLRAEAVVNEKALAQASREICELNGQLEDILNFVKNLKGPFQNYDPTTDR